METKLKKIKGIKKVYNSKANFILVKVQDPIGLFEFLVKNKILVRDRSNLVRDSLRLTVGTVSQNKLLLKTIEKYYE
jgi:histidinol-phosphate aminotransferase